MSNIPNASTVNSASLLIDSFVKIVVETYRHMYGKDFPKDRNTGAMREALEFCTTSATQLIAVGADTVYHDLEHTVDVTLAMQDILLGMASFETILPKDWFHAILAAAYHDVGYVTKLFVDDDPNKTGTLLTSKHVLRSARYVKERFEKSEIVSGNLLAELIEYTQVPIINKEDTKSYGALLRAADYIGQIANINIRKQKLALLYEFQDAGMADKFGYASLKDVIIKFPKFFETQVMPLIGQALIYLERTIPGQRKVNEIFGVIKRCELVAEGKLDL